MANNPFLTYRDRLDSYQPVREGKMFDTEFVNIVETIDASIGDIEGKGFVPTPVIEAKSLAAAAGLDVDLWVKVEAHNVGGSHKARHLMGTAIDMMVNEALGAHKAERLAIASCGNAALGAAVVAGAIGRQLDVFVPTWANEKVVARLNELGANVTHAERREGEAGDPAYLRFLEAVEAGAVPFSVQGTDTISAFDGGRTLGWELADQLDEIDAMYIQVGGGALATSAAMAVPARLHPVQAEGCAPLRRAWDKLVPDFDWVDAHRNPDTYMWPWDEPQSLASGLLDDITYDWIPVLQLTRETGGEPVVASEALIEKAYALAHEHTDVPVCASGSAGLAGLMQQPPPAGERVVLLFTGIDRT